MKAPQQVKWLDNSRHWPDLDRVWKPQKVLGSGAKGLCGLWKNGRIRSNYRNLPDYLVVKQAVGGGRDELRAESKFLEDLTSVSAEHCK